MMHSLCIEYHDIILQAMVCNILNVHTCKALLKIIRVWLLGFRIKCYIAVL